MTTDKSMNQQWEKIRAQEELSFNNRLQPPSSPTKIQSSPLQQNQNQHLTIDPYSQLTAPSSKKSDFYTFELNNKQYKLSTAQFIIFVVLLIGILLQGFIIGTRFLTSGQRIYPVTVVFRNFGNFAEAYHCLNSYFRHNHEGVQKVLFLFDGEEGALLGNLKQTYKNITFISTGTYLGQLASMDFIYPKITTKYYLHIETSTLFLHSGFISKSIYLLQKYPSYGHIALQSIDGKEIGNYTILDGLDNGFTLLPAMHRKADYDKLKKSKGGYVDITAGYSEGKEAGIEIHGIGFQYNAIGLNTYHMLDPHTISTKIPQKPKQLDQTKILLNNNYNSLTKKQQSQYKIAYYLRQLKLIKRIQNANQQYQYRRQYPIPTLPSKQYQGIDVTEYGVDSYIQFQSKLDYLNITGSQYSRKYVDRYWKTFIYDAEEIVMNQEDVLAEISREKNERGLEFNLARKIYDSRNNDSQSRAASYLFRLKNFIVRQQEICVVVYGNNAEWDNSETQNLIKSINNQLYNQISVVFVGNKQRIKKVYDNAVKKQLHKKVRKISLMPDAPYYKRTALDHFMYNLCPKNSIVVNLRPTDQLLGTRAFQIISSAYNANENLQFATFRTLQRGKPNDQLKNLDQSLLPQFRTKNTQNLVPFIKTYRQRMTIPRILQYLNQYYYNAQTKSARTVFYNTDSDDFQTYSLIQLAGPDRTEFFQQFLSIRNPTILPTERCYAQQQAYTVTKAQLKIPLKPLKFLDDLIQYDNQAKIPEDLLFKLRIRYKEMKKCIQG